MSVKVKTPVELVNDPNDVKDLSAYCFNMATQYKGYAKHGVNGQPYTERLEKMSEVYSSMGALLNSMSTCACSKLDIIGVPNLETR